MGVSLSTLTEYWRSRGFIDRTEAHNVAAGGSSRRSRFRVFVFFIGPGVNCSGSRVEEADGNHARPTVFCEALVFYLSILNSLTRPLTATGEVYVRVNAIKKNVDLILNRNTVDPSKDRLRSMVMAGRNHLSL